MSSLSRKALLQRLTELDQQITRLEGEREGIRFALGMVSQTSTPEHGSRARRSDVKNLILDLLETAGPGGLNAAIAVEMAAKQGVELKQASASSNLSRLKADGIVSYDNERYRLSKFSSGWTPNVHPHPASKGVFG